MKIFVDCFPGEVIKRGDIVQTNCGDKRERTCLVLRSRRSKVTFGRFHVWCERWWELEPDFRIRLFRSAERAGGQSVIMFVRYSVARRKVSVKDLYNRFL